MLYAMERAIYIRFYPHIIHNVRSKAVRLTRTQLTRRQNILTWYGSWVAAYRFRFVLPFDWHQIKRINRNLPKENSGVQLKVIINYAIYLLYKNSTWIIVSRSGNCVWYATKVTLPDLGGTGTWETIHLPRSNAYCAPSTSFCSFDLILSVWRGPCIDSSISPSLSETSNIMFSSKVPARQLCGTC
jgi:hypothetical protein